MLKVKLIIIILANFTFEDTECVMKICSEILSVKRARTYNFVIFKYSTIIYQHHCFATYIMYTVICDKFTSHANGSQK